jgi:hypothetical protein
MKALAFLLLVAASAALHAQDVADKLKFSGNGRIRFENQEFNDRLTGSSSFMSVRLRPTVNYKAHEQLNLVFEPQFAKRMGAETWTPSSATGNTLGETSGNVAYSGDPVTVYQGYMNVKFDDHFSLKGGRQAIKYGNELIMGPANWALYGRSFDALTARYADGGNFIDLIYGKIADFGARAGNVDDRDLYGAYASWNFGFWLKTADAYWFMREDRDATDTDGAGPDNGFHNRYSVYGARLVFEFGDFDLTTEYAKGDGDKVYVNDGSNTGMYNATLNYKINDKHKAGLEYSHAGKNWNDMYPTTNRALGRADVVGRRNIDAIAFHWTSDFSDYFGLEFDYYNLRRASTEAQIYKINTSTAFGSTTDSSKDIGQEFDLALKYKQNANISWSAAYCRFFMGSYAEKSQGLDKDPDFFYVMLETKF